MGCLCPDDKTGRRFLTGVLTAWSPDDPANSYRGSPRARLGTRCQNERPVCPAAASAPGEVRRRRTSRTNPVHWKIAPECDTGHIRSVVNNHAPDVSHTVSGTLTSEDADSKQSLKPKTPAFHRRLRCG
jgi:hypothetical protein